MHGVRTKVTGVKYVDDFKNLVLKKTAINDTWFLLAISVKIQFTIPVN
jgi:hypothetical protein